MNLPQIVQYGLSGITVGSIYAIVAIGFNIIYARRGSSTSPRASS